MKELIGKCKNCLGCNRLEDSEFTGVYRCENVIEEIKMNENQGTLDTVHTHTHTRTFIKGLDR